MDPRIGEFLKTATLPLLKQKLSVLGLPTAGNKPDLRLRLEDAVRNFSIQQIEQYLGNDGFMADGTDSSETGDRNNVSGILDTGASSDNGGSDLDALNRELEILKKKKEIIELKRQLAELNNNKNKSYTNTPFFNFRDIEESLCSFSGDDRYEVRKWVQQIDDAAEIYGWNDKTCFMYAHRLLTGTARLYLRTLSVKTWIDLKQLLIQEFRKKISNAETHNELRKRKRKIGETWQQYLFAMQEIASAADVSNTDLIQYVIGGINDSPVNKTILYNANSISELKQAFQKYDKMKASQRSSNVDQRKQTNLSMENTKTPIRRYNCNAVGHVLNKCPHPRRPKGSCFKYGKLGHKIQDCKETPILAVDSEMEKKEHHPNKFEFNIRYNFDDDETMKFDCILSTLIDTGSPISFVQERFLPPCLAKPAVSDKHKFCGINNSYLQVIGTVNCKVCFNGFEYNLVIYVVQNDTMHYPIILGRDFIELSKLELGHKDHSVKTEQEVNVGVRMRRFILRAEMQV